MDNDRRMPKKDKQVIHCQPSSPSISVRKGMDILKFSVKIRRRRQGVFRADAVQFFQQFSQFFRNILRGSAHLTFPGHIVMPLVLTGPLTELPTAGILGAMGQLELQFPDEGFIQRALVPERTQKQFMGFFRVADFK